MDNRRGNDRRRDADDFYDSTKSWIHGLSEDRRRAVRDAVRDYHAENGEGEEEEEGEPWEGREREEAAEDRRGRRDAADRRRRRGARDEPRPFPGRPRPGGSMTGVTRDMEEEAREVAATYPNGSRLPVRERDLKNDDDYARGYAHDAADGAIAGLRANLARIRVL